MLRRWHVSVCYPDGLSCTHSLFNYALFPVLITDLQTTMKISSFGVSPVLVKFLFHIKEKDNGVKPNVESNWDETRMMSLFAEPASSETVWMKFRVSHSMMGTLTRAFLLRKPASGGSTGLPAELLLLVWHFTLLLHHSRWGLHASLIQ